MSDEQFKEIGIVHGARLCPQELNRVLDAERELVRAGRSDGVKRIGDRENASTQRDLFSFEAVGIPCTVPFLMVSTDVLGDRKRELDLLQDLVAGGRMHFHLLEFLLAEPAGLVKDVVVDG